MLWVEYFGFVSKKLSADEKGEFLSCFDKREIKERKKRKKRSAKKTNQTKGEKKA